MWEDSGYFQKRKHHLQKQELIFLTLLVLKRNPLAHRRVHFLQHPATHTLPFLPSVPHGCLDTWSPSSRYRKTMTAPWMPSSQEPKIHSSSNSSVTSKSHLQFLASSGPSARKSCYPLLCVCKPLSGLLDPAYKNDLRYHLPSPPLP